MTLLALVYFLPVAVAASIAIALAIHPGPHTPALPVARGVCIGTALLCLTTAATHALT